MRTEMDRRPAILRSRGRSVGMARRSTSVIGTAVLAGMLIVACQRTPPPNSLDAEDVTTLERADRILATEVSPVENALLINAHGEVVESCMQHLGWDFEVPAATPETASGGPGSLSRLQQWTFADVAAAESTGYGFEAYLAEADAYLDQLAESQLEARQPDPITMSPDDAARFELDIVGSDDERIEIVERDGSNASVPGGGCLGEAGRAVWGDIEQELRLRDARGTAESDIWIATLVDDAVVDAREVWAECVAQSGHEFEDPEQAFQAGLAAARAGGIENERLIATADASCKAESGLDRAVEAAFLAAANSVLPDLEDDLLALQQFEAAALERAKEILGAGE